MEKNKSEDHKLTPVACKKTYSEHDQDDHKSTLRNSTGIPIRILSQKEQRAQADLLNIQPNEDMLDCFGEEQSTRIARRRLLILPQKQILVEHVERKECGTSETVDDRGDDRVSQSCEQS